MLSRKKSLSPEDYKEEVLNVPLINFTEYLLSDDIYYIEDDELLYKINTLLKVKIFDIKKFMFSFSLGYIIVLRLYYELESMNYIDTGSILDKNRYMIEREKLHDVVDYIYNFIKNFVIKTKNFKYTRR